MPLVIQPAWKTEAERLLENNGVNVGLFPSKRFRREFFQTIGHAYWFRLMKIAEARNLSNETIAKRLGLVGSTKSRWESGDNPAGADKFFAVVLLVLRSEINELHLGLGTRRVLLFESVCLQLERLAHDYDSAPSCKLDHFMLKSIILAMHVPQVNVLAPNSNVKKAEAKEALAIVTNGLNAALKRDFDREVERRQNIRGSAKKILPSQVDEWLASWGIAYTLFAMGCEKVTSWRIEDVID